MCPRGSGEQGDIIIYFKETRDILGINLTEQGISFLLRELCQKNLGKSEIFKESAEYVMLFRGPH